jgi:hypothetical protein
VKRAARSSLRRPLRVKPALSDNHAGPFDETKNNTPSDCSALGQVSKRGRAEPQVSDYSVGVELPEDIPVLENELRALETLLGIALKELLAERTRKPLK